MAEPTNETSNTLEKEKIMKGGKRPGAGRPAGARNRKTAEMTAAIEASGMTPLEYMVAVMRDSDVDAQMRLEAARGAAPYVHARLNSTEITNGDTPQRSEEAILADLKALTEKDAGLKDILSGLVVGNPH